jgi:hypothetical protein
LVKHLVSIVCAVVATLASTDVAVSRDVWAVPLRYFEAKNDDRSLVSAYRNEWDAIHLRGDFYDGNQFGWVFVEPALGTVPLYRFMNPSSGDHFFTTYASEGQQAIQQFGYVAEGICCYLAAPVNPAASASVKLYRWRKGSFHRYTLSSSEPGWTLEGVAGYLWKDYAGLPAQ